MASPMNFSMVPPWRSSSRLVWAEQRRHVLRVHLLGARREADQVVEEDGDDLALLSHRRPSLSAAAWLADRGRGPA